MSPIVQAWLASEKYHCSLMHFRHNVHMIKCIIHHFKMSPVTKEDVLLLILPVSVAAGLLMGLITFALLILNS